MPEPLPPGLLLAAPGSGAGKTTVMLGLARAFTEDGLRVQAFKSGPDYIDPAFHEAATGRASFNLDTWAMGPDLLGAIAAEAEGADLCLCEGSMGLFDGVATSGRSGCGASAETAKAFGWPVVLVLDCGGQAQSAAATALGFARFDPALHLAGVILNRLSSARHERLVRAGMAAAGLPVFGALPRRGDLALPERHLGLVQAVEHPDIEAAIAGTAGFLRAHVDLALLRAAARATRAPRSPARGAGAMRPGTTAPDGTGAAGAPSAGAPSGAATGTRADTRLPPPPAQRIALARDAAFSFMYPHLLAAWRRAGAEILPFSPLADEPPDPAADLVWLPGGYPELHAGRLAAATRFLAGLRAHARQRPVHGECGGYMALGEALIDARGHRHRMAGLLGLVTSFAERRLHLGYRRAVLAAAMPGHGPGAVLRGHEFHYSTVVAQPDAPLAEVRDADGAVVPETGSCRDRVSGTFFHLIAEESP
jgi:cobyrinic acid a,c-diamide synthase